MLNPNVEYKKTLIKCDPLSEKFAFYGASFYDFFVVQSKKPMG